MSTTIDQKDGIPKVPTKNELITYFKEQTEVKKHQLEMQKVNTQIAKLRSEEVEAFAKIAMITHQAKGGEEDSERPTGPTEPDN